MIGFVCFAVVNANKISFMKLRHTLILDKLAKFFTFNRQVPNREKSRFDGGRRQNINSRRGSNTGEMNFQISIRLFQLFELMPVYDNVFFCSC